jgi:hypothetical protein
MGLWREHLHWSVLLKWSTIAALVPSLITLGGVLLMPDQFRLAKACFILAGLLCLAKITHLATSTPDRTHTRLIFAVAGYALVGLLTITLVRGVNSYAARQSAAPPRGAAATETVANTSTSTQSGAQERDAKGSTTTSAPDDTERVPGSHSNPLRLEPRVLSKLYDDHTILKADLLFSQYKGKWILISGKVGDVVGYDRYVQVLLAYDYYRPTVSMSFERETQRGAVALLNRGDKITAVCRIKQAQSHGLFVEQCELLQ